MGIERIKGEEMAYSVKYIGDCITKNTNIKPLYIDDLNHGIKIILVCEKEYEALIDIEDIEKFYNIIDVKEMRKDIAVLFSDNPKTDAVYLAVQFDLAECEFFTEYNGIYSVNPKEYDFAKKIDRIDYDELLIISDSGYKFISGQVLEIAKRYSIAIRVLSYNIQNEIQDKGSLIKEALGSELNPIKAIIKDPNYCIVTITGVSDEKGISYKIFKAISDAEIVIDSIVLPAANLGVQDISFTVLNKNRQKVEEILKKKVQELRIQGFNINNNIAKISLIGSALQTSFGIGTAVFKVLYENDINLKMINSGEIKVSVFIDKKEADLALKKLHEILIK